MKILSRATEQLLRPVGINKSDRLRISLNKDSTRFVVTPYGLSTLPTIVTASGTKLQIENISHLERVIEANGGHASVKIENTERKIYPSIAAQRSWLERVPERKQVHDGGTFPSWEIATTDFSAIVTRALWPVDQIVFEEDDARKVYEYLCLTSDQLEMNADAYASFKESKQLPSDDFAEVHPDVPLAPYQRLGLYNSMRSEGYGLFMEQGTGKTPIVVARVSNECKAVHATENRMYRAIIVCPKNVRLNWVREFNKFSTQRGKCVAVRGGPIRRMQALFNALVPDPVGSDDDEVHGQKFSVCVVSYETLCRMPELLQIKWDLAVCDESHFIKSPNADRTKAAHRLRDASRQRMCLTGTPITNTHFDLWAQFEFMGKGWSGFSSYHNFRAFFGVFDPEGRDGYEKLVGIQNKPLIKERLAKQTFMISLEEALPDLPKKRYDIVEIEMTPRQRDVYDELRKNLIVQIESDLDSDRNKALVVNNVLTKLLRLAQITSGFITWSDATDLDEAPARVIERLHPCPKFDAIVEATKAKGPLEKTIVWCCWVPDIKDLKTRLDAEGIDAVCYYGSTKEDEREHNEWRFNCDPTCRVLIGNAAAGGMGINLPGYDINDPASETNVTQVFYLSQNWSPTARQQSENRCHGKNRCRRSTLYTDLVVPGTIDEEIRIAVLEKKMNAMEISDIRKILHNVLHGVISDD